MSLNPPSFDGKSSPEAAEDWIKEIERIFRVLQVGDDRKVDFGTYRLRKDAERWWATTWEIKFDNQPVEWDQFVEAFYAAYFPAHKRSRKMQEFLDLQQVVFLFLNMSRDFVAWRGFVRTYTRQKRSELLNLLEV